MTHYFVLAVSIVNTVWALTWSRSTLLNWLIKLGFAGLAIWGWYLIFRGSI